MWRDVLVALVFGAAVLEAAPFFVHVWWWCPSSLFPQRIPRAQVDLILYSFVNTIFQLMGVLLWRSPRQGLPRLVPCKTSS